MRQQPGRTVFLVIEVAFTTWDRWFAMMDIPYLKARGAGWRLKPRYVVKEWPWGGACSLPVTLFPEARLDVEWGYDLVYQSGSPGSPEGPRFQELDGGRGPRLHGDQLISEEQPAS